MQALYAWQLSGAAPADLVAQMKEREGQERADVAFAERLLRGVIADAEHRLLRRTREVPADQLELGGQGGLPGRLLAGGPFRPWRAARSPLPRA